MGLKEIINKIKEFGNHEQNWDVPDDETQDKALRSLRRRRRIQLEEFEKQKLKKEIAEHEMFRTRRDVIGGEGYNLLGNNKKHHKKVKTNNSYFGKIKI